LVVPLCKILTACLTFGYVSKTWQKMRVIFIPKPRRSSYEPAKSFRPISLTYLLLKTMERLSDFHINEGPLKDYPLNPMQHAYLKSKSTETALHDHVYKNDESLAQKDLPWASSSISRELLTTHLLNRWMTRRAIMVSVQL
jgi:hypothetical protein